MSNIKILVPLDKVRSMAAHGATISEIALALGYKSPRNFFNRKKKYKDIQEAIEEGRAQGIVDIENALYKSAKDGNVTAQIFFLKNRASEKWSDKQDVKLNARIGVKSLDELSDAELLAIVGSDDDLGGRG